MTETVARTSEETIVAKPSGSYRFKWIVMSLALIGYGGWSIYDGFVRYPRENDHATRPTEQGGLGLEKAPHPGYDVPFNRVIGILLPPLGLAALAWTIYNSRGEYRLEGETLRIPGHPSLQLSDIREVDKSKWERKGIAYLEYEAAGGAAKARLDDYIYERRPTDAIMERIEAAIVPSGLVDAGGGGDGGSAV